MLLSSSSHGDVKGTSDYGEGGGALTLFDSGINPLISVVTHRKSDGERLDVLRFATCFIIGTSWNCKIALAQARYGA